MVVTLTSGWRGAPYPDLSPGPVPHTLPKLGLSIKVDWRPERFVAISLIRKSLPDSVTGLCIILPNGDRFMPSPTHVTPFWQLHGALKILKSNSVVPFAGCVKLKFRSHSRYGPKSLMKLTDSRVIDPPKGRGLAGWPCRSWPKSNMFPKQ